MAGLFYLKRRRRIYGTPPASASVGHEQSSQPAGKVEIPRAARAARVDESTQHSEHFDRADSSSHSIHSIQSAHSHFTVSSDHSDHSDLSNHSDHTDPTLVLQHSPVQPVFDGFPGSTGYDDVRTSLHATFQHSATWSQLLSAPHSPSTPPAGDLGREIDWYGAENYYPFPIREAKTDREELLAARLYSSPPATVVSYGPNPITPTPEPRAREFKMSARVSWISNDSREGIPPTPSSLTASSSRSSYLHDSASRSHEPAPRPRASFARRQHHSPNKPAPPLIVSYGPNRVTPTPAVLNPTVPLDDAMIRQRGQDPWEFDEPMMATVAPLPPLPPYASLADFNAMEKGAIRKMAEPLAQAELPPTKDGFYHFTADITEYELPGAAPTHPSLLPYHPYHTRQTQQSTTCGRVAGGSTGVRDVDEQKFLLSDAEILRLREQKAKIRATHQAARLAAEPSRD